MNKLLIISVSIALVSGAVSAATVNTIYKVDGNNIPNTPECTGSNIDVGLGTTTCTFSGNQNNNLYTTEMAARADELSFGIRASTSVEGDPSLGFVGGSSIGGNVSHNFLDTVTFSVSSGTWLLPIDVFGSFAVSEPPIGLSGGGGTASAFMGVNVTADSIVTTVYNRQVQEATGLTGLDNVTGSLGTTILELDFDNGKLDLVLGLFGGVGCIGRFYDSTCNSSVDFFQSARILGTTVLDDQGNVAVDQTVQSLSGFDYLTGAQPHNLPAIPLPAAGWLLLTGFAALFGFISRRQVA